MTNNVMFWICILTSAYVFIMGCCLEYLMKRDTNAGTLGEITKFLKKNTLLDWILLLIAGVIPISGQILALILSLIIIFWDKIKNGIRREVDETEENTEAKELVDVMKKLISIEEKIEKKLDEK